jgi:hypothetical protein
MLNNSNAKLGDAQGSELGAVLPQDADQGVDPAPDRLLAALPVNPIFDAFLDQRYGVEADLIGLRLNPLGHGGELDLEAIGRGMAGVSAALDLLRTGR